MKYLATHSETRRLLKESTVEKWCIIATHYFWMSGSSLQHNMKGCLANLCWQLIRTEKARADQLLETTLRLAPSPDLSEILHQRFAALPSKRYLEDWSARELESFLQYLVNIPTTKVCIFLDGLDEYNQSVNLGEIMSLITRITQKSKVKVCVSSRPELSLESSLTKHPHMQIHDFTRTDVIALAKSRFRTVVAESGLSQITDNDTACLADSIATAAEGVFIWALLAVENIAEGMYMTDDVSTLCNTLSAMPEALQDCYDITMRRVRNKSGPVDAWVQNLFTMPIEIWTSFNIMFLSVGALQLSKEHSKITSYTLAQWLRDSEYLRRQIHTQSAGLLQSPSWPSITQLHELISKHRDVKLGCIIETLIPGFRPMKNPVHLDAMNHATITTPVDLLRYIDHDEGLRRCLTATIRPVHRTVHDFFHTRASSALNQIRTLEFCQLIDQSLVLPILFSGATKSHACCVYPQKLDPAFLSDVSGWARNTLAALSRRDIGLPLKPVFDAVACFVHSSTLRLPGMGKVAAQDVVRVGAGCFAFRGMTTDTAGFVHMIGLNLMCDSNFLTGCEASLYYKGYLLNCYLTGPPDGPSRIEIRDSWAKILSMLASGADMLTPQVLTNKYEVEILSPLSRCFVYLLRCLAYETAGIDHFETLLHGLHAKLRDKVGETSGKHQANDYAHSKPNVESDIEICFDYDCPELKMRLSVNNFYRFVTDLFQAKCTKDCQYL